MNANRTRNALPSNATAAADDVESFIERYEAAADVTDDVALSDYVPSAEHRSYRHIVTELIRVDLEIRWQAGRPQALGEYRNDYPDVFADLMSLRAIAFEEYRLRCQHGQRAAPRDYAALYNIDVSDWPTFASQVSLERESPTSAQFAGSCPDAAMDVEFPAVGTTFSGFELVAELGRGAFARVYLARQTELACRFIALKVSVGANLEAQRLAQLQHTNIVPIYSVHRQGKFQAVAMPFFGATTLAGVLRTVRRHASLPASARELLSTLAAEAASTVKGDLGAGSITAAPSDSEETSTSLVAFTSTASSAQANTPRDAIERLSYVDAAVWIVARIAEGLAHAHARGLLHRDLKPANILLTDDGQPMILDFNLAADMGASATNQGSIGGTLPYMAPEHLEVLAARVGSAPLIDARADVYSLGVMLFELLTGQQPFPLRTGALGDVALVMAVDRRGAVPSARAKNPSIPRSIDAIIRKALASDVRQRYAAASEMADDLNRHLADLPLRYATDRAPIERAQKWVRRHPRLSSVSSMATLCVVLLVGIAVAWQARQRHFAGIAAVSQFDAFSAKLRSIRAPLSAFDLDAGTLTQTIADAESILSEYDVIEDSNWQRADRVALLDDGQRQALAQSVGETALLLGRALERQAAIVTSRRAASFKKSSEFRALGDALVDEAARANDPYLAALEAARDAQYDRAIALLAQARADDPQDIGVWFSLGNVFAAIGRHHEAEGCFTTAAALEPASPWPLFYRGATRMSLREFARAEEDFSASLAVKPDWAVAYANRGLARISLGKPQAALADLDRALELGCSQTRLYLVRAKLRRAQGDVAGADNDIEQGLKLEPTDDKSWVSRALARLPKDAPGALADLKQAAGVFPGSRVIQQDLAHVLGETLHDNAAALNVMNALVAMSPNDVDALTGRAVLLARLGRREAALADAQLAARIQSTAETSYKLACVYALGDRRTAADGDAAVRFVAQAIRQDSRFVEVARHDADLESIRQRADFRRVLQAGDVIRKASQETSSGE